MIAKRVGSLCAALGEAVPALMQIRINDVIGVRTRAYAGKDQLRTGLRQVQAWLRDPRSFTKAG